jgi:gas vesicle protein
VSINYFEISFSTLNFISIMSNTKIFLGFLVGVAAGVVAGVLLAPEKGNDTRKMLIDKAKDLSSDAIDKLNPQLEKASELAKSLTETIGKTLNEYSAKVFKRNAQEVKTESES